MTAIRGYKSSKRSPGSATPGLLSPSLVTPGYNYCVKNRCSREAPNRYTVPVIPPEANITIGAHQPGEHHEQTP